jgi:O-antigen ligase
VKNRVAPTENQRLRDAAALATGLALAVVALVPPSLADRDLVGLALGAPAARAGLFLLARRRPLPRWIGGLGGLWVAAGLLSLAVSDAGLPQMLLPSLIGLGLAGLGAALTDAPTAGAPTADSPTTKSPTTRSPTTRSPTTGRLLTTLLIAAAVAALHALLQHLQWDPLPRLDEFPQRVVGPFDNPNHLASFLALALVPGLALYLDAARHPAGRRLWLTSAAILVLYGGLLLAGSRGGIAAAAAGGVVVVAAVGHAAWRRGQAPGWRPVAALVLGLGLVTWALQARPIMQSHDGTRQVSVGQRLEAIPNIAGPSIAGEKARTDVTVVHRRLLWRTAWGTFLQHPWVGVGPGAYGRAVVEQLPHLRGQEDADFLDRQGRLQGHRFAHNEWLQSLAERGLVGTLPWLGLLLAWTLAAWRLLWRPGDPSVVGAIGACAAVLVHGLVSYPLYLPATLGIFWILYGICIRTGFDPETTRAIRSELTG